MSIRTIIKNPSTIIENPDDEALSLILLFFYFVGYFFLPIILYSSLEGIAGSEWESLWEALMWIFCIVLLGISLFPIIKTYRFCNDHIKNNPDDGIKKKYRLIRTISNIFIAIFFFYDVIWIFSIVPCEAFDECLIEANGNPLVYSVIYLVTGIIFAFAILGLFKLIFSSKEIPQIFKKGGAVFVCGALGSAAALYAPIILAYIQQGSVDLDISDSRMMFYAGASIIFGALTIFWPKMMTDNMDIFTTSRKAAILGLAFPSLLFNTLEGTQNHELKPKDGNGVNVEKVQGGRILQLKTSSIYQAPSPNINIPFISSAYAEEHTDDIDEVPLDSDSSNNLNSNLNKRFNAAARLVNSIASKKYIISIAEFSTEDEAFTYYTKCIQDSYNITNSYVLELIPDSNYRIIFPSLDDKLSRGEANYKLYLLSENMKKEGDCLKTELSILEFE